MEVKGKLIGIGAFAEDANGAFYEGDGELYGKGGVGPTKVKLGALLPGMGTAVIGIDIICYIYLRQILLLILRKNVFSNFLASTALYFFK